MSLADAAHEGKHEIIIVRHGGGDHEDGHHGGAWKIAFADFMTAMMCFFLVMWLINAANEQTKASVASYFNPVKLIDRNSSRKGLEDIGDGPNSVGATAENPATPDKKSGSEGQANAGSSSEANSKDTADKVAHSDDHLFADPYAVLAEIAADTGIRQNISAKGDGGAQDAGPATGASGGDSYRDPFAPDFWTQQVASPLSAEATAERNDADKLAEETADPGMQAAPSEKTTAALEKAESESDKPGDPEVETARLEVTGEAPPQDPFSPSVKMDPPAAETKPDAQAPAPGEPAPEKTGPSDTAIREATEIRQELAKAFNSQDKMLDGLSVVATDRGVVISITDQLDFGMFEIGSALPRREMVIAMEKIAKTIAARPGTLTISGHTDARPFKSDKYDNWRLSTARAHSAYYMLARAGLDEKRITEVGGFADRKPKVANDPLAASNRRIEIMLEVKG